MAKLQDFPTIYFTTLFYVQGRKVWSVKLPHSVLCIEKMDIPSRGLFLVAVALASNHVLVYNDKNVVDCFKMDDTVSAMKFGRFGREENTLVLGKLCDRQNQNNLRVKMIMRKAVVIVCSIFSDDRRDSEYEDSEEDRTV